MRTLVTGASGYIGRPLVDALTRRGADVITVRRADADLRNPAAARALVHRYRPDAIVHSAWEATPGVYWTSPDNAAWAAGTFALAQAAQECGTQRFVGVGSCAEYDWTSGDCDEGTTPEVPTTPYGLAKLEAARGVIALSTDACPVAWTRVFFLFGGAEHPARLVPSVALALREGREALCTHGEQLRDFLHVDDVADAIAAVTFSRVTGVINIARGQTHRVRDVIEGLAARLQRPDLVRLGARPSHEPPRLATRATRLHHDVQWQPHRSFEASLDAAAAWWQGR